jgi:hypothetical protein
MTYEKEVEIAASIISIGQRMLDAVTKNGILPFEVLQCIDEANEAFETLLELVEENPALQEQIRVNLEKLKNLRIIIQIQV